MKHLIVIYSTPGVAAHFAAMSEHERTTAFQVYWDVEGDLEATGELVDSKAVDEDGQITVHRDGDGAVSTSPVPADADVVSGYYLVDVADRDRAVAIAARFPEAAVPGAIRVTRVLTQDDFDAMGA